MQWLAIIAIVDRLSAFYSNHEQAHTITEYRKLQRKNRWHAIERLSKIPVIVMFVRKFKESLRVRQACLIRRFLQDIQSSRMASMAIRQFSRNIRTLQTMLRLGIATHHAKMQLVLFALDRTIFQYSELVSTIFEKSSAKDPRFSSDEQDLLLRAEQLMPNAKQPLNNFSRIHILMSFKETLQKTSTSAKRKLVREHLRAKSSEFQNRLQQYMDDYEIVLKQTRLQKRAKPPFQPPRFRLCPNRDDLFQLCLALMFQKKQ